MARRRKMTHKRHHTKRRHSSVGAKAGSMIMDIAGVVAGAVIAKQLNKVLKFDAKVLAAGKIVAGVMLPKFIKNPLVAGIGEGMIAIGGTELIGAFVPSLAGTDDVVLLSGLDNIGNYDMSGIDTIGADVSEVNGFDVAEVNGYDEY
jgi:hypothetical protein